MYSSLKLSRHCVTTFIGLKSLVETSKWAHDPGPLKKLNEVKSKSFTFYYYIQLISYIFVNCFLFFACVRLLFVLQWILFKIKTTGQQGHYKYRFSMRIENDERTYTSDMRLLLLLESFKLLDFAFRFGCDVLSIKLLNVQTLAWQFCKLEQLLFDNRVLSVLLALLNLLLHRLKLLQLLLPSTSKWSLWIAFELKLLMFSDCDVGAMARIWSDRVIDSESLRISLSLALIIECAATVCVNAVWFWFW